VGTASALALKDALKLDVGLKMDLKVNSLIKQQIKIKQEMIIKSPNHTRKKKNGIKTVKECEGCIHDGDCGNQIDKKI